MTVYEYIVEEARQHGTTIHIDLKNHDIRIGKHYILKEGKPTTKTFDSLIEFDGDAYAEIERLYAQFKRSVPGRREKLNRGYFKALSSDALTMDELINNKPRLEVEYVIELAEQYNVPFPPRVKSWYRKNKPSIKITNGEFGGYYYEYGSKSHSKAIGDYMNRLLNALNAEQVTMNVD